MKDFIYMVIVISTGWFGYQRIEKTGLNAMGRELTVQDINLILFGALALSILTGVIMGVYWFSNTRLGVKLEAGFQKLLGGMSWMFKQVRTRAA